MKLRFKLMVIGTMVAGLLAPLASAQAQSAVPETVLARVTSFGLYGTPDVHAGCRLDAGYGKDLWFNSCGVNRRDHHWYGTTEHEMWQRKTYNIQDHQKVIIVTHAGFRCEHGKEYQAWSYGRSTGFFNMVDNSAHTSWKKFC